MQQQFYSASLQLSGSTLYRLVYDLSAKQAFLNRFITSVNDMKTHRLTHCTYNHIESYQIDTRARTRKADAATSSDDYTCNTWRRQTCTRARMRCTHCEFLPSLQLSGLFPLDLACISCQEIGWSNGAGICCVSRTWIRELGNLECSVRTSLENITVGGWVLLL
jgi:hypothetical protein